MATIIYILATFAFITLFIGFAITVSDFKRGMMQNASNSGKASDIQYKNSVLYGYLIL